MKMIGAEINRFKQENVDKNFFIKLVFFLDEGRNCWFPLFFVNKFAQK